MLGFSLLVVGFCFVSICQSFLEKKTKPGFSTLLGSRPISCPGIWHFTVCFVLTIAKVRQVRFISQGIATFKGYSQQRTLNFKSFFFAINRPPFTSRRDDLHTH